MSERERTVQERLFVLRLWQDGDGELRASLKDLGDKEARYFGSFGTLAKYLRSMYTSTCAGVGDGDGAVLDPSLAPVGSGR